MIIAGSEDNSIYCFSVPKDFKNACQKLDGHEDKVMALDCITRNNVDILVSGGAQNDCTIKLWEMNHAR